MKLYSLILLIFIMSEIQCFTNCDVCSREYTRTKRAKYYSNGPPKFFNLPPMSSSIIGPFSYTPPPHLTNNGVAGNSRPYQVSNRLNTNGLADEDIQNIVKYLNRQDLEKLVELATEKERYKTFTQDKFNVAYNTNQYKEHRPIYKDLNDEYNVKSFPYSKVNDEIKPNNFEYRTPFGNSFQENPRNMPFDNFLYSQAPVNDMSLQDQAAFLDAYIQKEMNGLKPDKNINLDSLIMQEEALRRPTNMREQDYEIAATNNLPNVVKDSPSSYKLENFGELPLMNYDDSKLDVVNSYNVPHYTITQYKSAPQKPSLETLPPIESPPPPPQTGRDQSEAHLVAIKIWTHKSKGTAYTVNDDGTLTLEKPLRPKLKFT